MEIINNKTVVVSDSSELKEALESDNGYTYIYLSSDITLESGININENKQNITINGTYMNNKYTLTGMNSIDAPDTMVANMNNSQIQVKNMNIIYTNPYGVIYVPLDKNYSNLQTIYDNITFNGTQLSYNPYGVTKINDCLITIETKNEVASQEICEANYVIIGGNTTITSSSVNSSLFYFRNDTTNPTIVFLCQSNISISTDTKEFMSGTNKLNFTILHDTSVNIITGNGFGSNTIYGVNNVLIDERAFLTFIEKSHKRIPMWTIYGSFTMKKDSKLHLINSYDNTPSDNYNIHFKGNNCRLILEDPDEVIIYTKNANVIYTNNPLNYVIKCKRINMWVNSTTLTSAGDINNLPDYSWYKEDDLIDIEGIITSTATTITKYNLTASDLKNLPDIGNFAFQNRKQFSIGNNAINVHPISSTINKISGHTNSMADVLIKYNSITEIVTADSGGYFEYTTPSTIENDTSIEITSNVSTSFIYGTRKITSPYNGELSLMEGTKVFKFLLAIISADPIILPKDRSITLKVVDSRINSSNFKIYAYIENPVKSQNGYILEDALVFEKLDDEMIVLNDTPQLIFTGTDNGGSPKRTTIEWSRTKGPLLDLSNNFLEANEEYFAEVKFVIEE